LKAFRILTASTLATLFAAAAQAQTISITNRTYGTIATIPGAQSIIDTQLDTLQSEINKALPGWESNKVANATALAGSGLGADYSDVFSWALLGGNVGVSAGSNIFSFMKGDAKLDTLPAVGAQGNVLLGFNLGQLAKAKFGFFDMSKLKVYASFFSYSHNINFDDFGLDASVSHWSLKGQYKLFSGVGPGLARWTGVDITSGLSQSKTTLKLSTSISQSVDVDGVPGVTSFSFTGKPVIDIDSSVFVIPVDVSTGVQLGYFLNLYAGLGLDFVFGSSKIPAADFGDISGSGAAASEITADVLLSETSGSPTVANMRYFAGLGLDGKVIGTFVQFNGNVTGQLGGTVGVRAYW